MRDPLVHSNLYFSSVEEQILPSPTKPEYLDLSVPVRNLVSLELYSFDGTWTRPSLIRIQIGRNFMIKRAISDISETAFCNICFHWDVKINAFHMYIKRIETTYLANYFRYINAFRSRGKNLTHYPLKYVAIF
jgi:hypothetical protein